MYKGLNLSVTGAPSMFEPACPVVGSLGNGADYSGVNVRCVVIWSCQNNFSKPGAKSQWAKLT